MARYVLGFRTSTDAGRARRRQGAYRRAHDKASVCGRLLRNDGRFPADHRGSAVDPMDV